MNIDHLNYIVEVAKSGSISAAAEKLHLSSATISQSISNFEKTYNTTIFKRTRAGSIPTEEGKRIIEKAYDIVNKAKELEMEALGKPDAVKELKIVTSPGVLLSFLPKCISNFKEDYPNVKLEVLEQSENIIKEIKFKDEYDLGFISVTENLWIKWGYHYKEKFHFDTLVQGRLYVCVSKNSSFLFKDGIAPEDLSKQVLIFHSPLKPLFADFFYQYPKIKMLFESNNTELIKKMVRQNLGVTLLSDLVLKNDPYVLNGDLVIIPLVNYERANLTYGMIRSRTKPFSDTARDFLSIVKQQISKGDY